MHGPQDMGGRDGFGPVIPEENEPIFHAEWEKSVLALTVAMGFTGMWNLDKSRSARETLPWHYYLTASYYNIWLAALENIMIAHDLLTREEIKQGKSIHPPAALKRILKGEDTAEILKRGGPVAREAQKRGTIQSRR